MRGLANESQDGIMKTREERAQTNSRNETRDEQRRRGVAEKEGVKVGKSSDGLVKVDARSYTSQ